MAAPFRVLVVEDEGLVAMMLEDLLQDLGCEVAGSAASIAQAMAWIDAGGEADAALLDVNVAGESVFPVADALAARGVAVAFTTGYGEGFDRRFENAVVLGKPIRQDRLETALRGFGFER